jgi:hypothetical protein
VKNELQREALTGALDPSRYVGGILEANAAPIARILIDLQEDLS